MKKNLLKFAFCGLLLAVGAMMAKAQTNLSPLKVDREYVGINYLQDPDLAASIGLKKTYTGKGVLIAVFDLDMQPSHVAFRDLNTGKSRVICVLDNSTIISDPDSIMQYAKTGSTHGNHVASIAAGSYDGGLGLRGVATDALLAFSVYNGGLYSLARTDGLDYIDKLATSLNMPCVVNISAGSAGALMMDGNTYWTKGINKFTANGTAPGRIVIKSAGNEGRSKTDSCYRYTFSSDVDTVHVFQILSQEPSNYFDLNALFTKPGKIIVEAYDTISHQVVDNVILCENEETLEFEPVSNAVATDMFVSSQESSGMYYVTVDGSYDIEEPNVVVRYTLTSEAGSNLRTNYSSLFVECSGEGITPNSVLTINGLDPCACITSVISVGNMCARNVVKDSITYHPGMMFPSSGWGTDDLGRKHPDVCAPGAQVTAAMNDVYASTPNAQEWYYTWKIENPLDEDPAQDYWWGCLSGTSQAAPIVTGVVALLLEENPKLTANELRELLHSTNDWTEDCENNPYGPEQAGWGILNAKDLMLAMINGTPTGVTDVEAVRSASNVAYDLTGRVVDESTYKGMVIKNGRKLILK